MRKGAQHSARTILGCFAALLVLAFGTPASAKDLGAMAPDEITSLQHRLTDDGCYTGPIDGTASTATAEAIKQCPDQTPILRIETGMHTAPIRRIAVSANCRLMATASEDKTLRLWLMPQNQLIRTIRLPIDGGKGGQAYAVALSRDGRTLVAGGWDAAADQGKKASLYIIDVRSGNIHRIGAFDDIISEIAVSPDGMHVAVGLHSGGLRVLDLNTGQQIMSDTIYDEAVYGLIYSYDGSLFTTSFDHFLRRYDSNFKKIAMVPAPIGLHPLGISVDPSNQRVAVGYDDKADIAVLDAKTLGLKFSVSNSDIKAGSLQGVTWSDDGHFIVAGGSAVMDKDRIPYFLLRRFSEDGKIITRDTPASLNTIESIKSCGNYIFYGAADLSFGIMNMNGELERFKTNDDVDMRGKIGTGLALSSDAQSVIFGLGVGSARPVSFDVQSAKLSDNDVPKGDFHVPKTRTLNILNWLGSPYPSIDGKIIQLADNDVSLSLAIRSDKLGFVLGTAQMFVKFQIKKPEGLEGVERMTPGETYGVNLSDDGNVIVAAYSDGTIRWYSWSSGAELLTLFVNRETKQWVAWTRSGFYMASAGGEDLIGWHVNRGWEQQADFFPASRFRDTYNRPDIVRAVLTTLDEDKAIEAANTAARRAQPQKPVAESLPPVVTITAPPYGASVAAGPIEIHFDLRPASSGAPVDRVEAFVDGARIEARGLGRSDEPGGKVTIAMPPHDATISLVAYAGKLASDAARLDLKALAASAPEADALKPTLYALLIGVTHYDRPAFDLGYPAKDATDLAAALMAQRGGLYKDVVVKVLTDHEASSTAVRKGLNWLEKQMTARDLAVVFAAGHGETDPKGRFWFLTADADRDDLRASAVSRDDFTDVLFDLPGKKLLFLDACHSGAALNPGGERSRGAVDVDSTVNAFAQAEGGVVVYAASTGREVSWERDEWGHGAFTKALIEGIGQGKADLLHNGSVTTATLDAFLEDRVKDLTHGQQHPVMNRPKTVPDFPIAVVH